jgi:hypothetical protein
VDVLTSLSVPIVVQSVLVHGSVSLEQGLNWVREQLASTQVSGFDWLQIQTQFTRNNFGAVNSLI